MLKYIPLICLAALLVMLPQPGAAQEPLVLPGVQIDLWPEYDRPEMLVIYYISLPENVSLPQTISIRIPAEIGTLNGVAVRQADGTLLNAPYELRADGEWNQVLITATLPELQLEYYDARLVKDGSNRYYEFAWLSDYSLEQLNIQVQQPLRAENFSVTPDLGSFQVDANSGLAYYFMGVGALTAGDQIRVEVEYEKDSDSLTVEAFKVGLPEPINTDTAGRVDWSSVVPWILGAFGVLLLFGGAFWYWQTGQERAPARAPRRRGQRGPARSAPVKTNVDADDLEQGVYCHQCGKRAAAGDRFCRSCGTRLRIE